MDRLKSALAWIVVLGLFCWGVWAIVFSESAQQHQREQIAQEAADRKPHVVREADGCKVYAFLSEGRWHYFTRCPASQTTTESNWQECHLVGKFNSCTTKTETIESKE